MKHSLKKTIFLGPKASLNKVQRTEVIQSVFSSHSRIKPEINKKKTTKTFPKCLKIKQYTYNLTLKNKLQWELENTLK